MTPNTPIDPAYRASTDAELKVREKVPGTPPLPPVGNLPAGGAKWAVPHAESKVSLINLSSRTYRWTHDEALKHSRQNARAVLRDLTVRNALTARWTPVVQLSWHLEPQDPTDPVQTEAAAKLTKIVERTPRLQDFFSYCLWGEWFGRAGVALVYRWEVVGGELCMCVADHRPINGDSLVARWDGEWGQLVNGTFEGEKDVGDGVGMAHYYTPSEREAVIIHTAPAEDVDFYESELAGQIRGSGLRGHIYWWWWLKSNFQALLADFSERFAQGVWIGWFEAGNDSAKREMDDAITGYNQKRSLLFPRTPEGQSAYGLEIKEVGTQNPAFLQAQVDKMNDLIHKYLTYQSINEVDVAVGGDGAGLVTDRIARGVKYSASRLAETLTTEWMPTLARYNTPGVPPPKFRYQIDTPDAASLIHYAERLVPWGYTPPVDDFVKLSGLPVASEGDTVYSKIQPLSPVMDQQPTGVPISQTPDPNQQQAPPQQQPEPQPTLLD